MPQPYKLAEDRQDELALTTEFFIDAPDGRMSVRLPNFIARKEQERLAAVVVSALNVDVRYRKGQ